MYPIRTFRMTIAAIALLLTACAPAAMANTPTIANADPTATDAVVALAEPTEAAASSVPTAPPTALVTEAPAQSSLAVTTDLNAATTNTAALSASAAPATVAQPQGPAYENLISPVDLLASYYDAINRKQYQRAYGYWQSPPLSYQSFASGFNDTSAIQLIVQPPTSGEGAAGSTYVQVPSVLIAQHTDGSTHTYAGCFVTRKSNLLPPDIPKADVWHIYQAQLQEVANSASIPKLLAQACQS